MTRYPKLTFCPLRAPGFLVRVLFHEEVRLIWPGLLDTGRSVVNHWRVSKPNEGASEQHGHDPEGANCGTTTGANSSLRRGISVRA